MNFLLSDLSRQSIWKGDKDDKEEAVRSIHGLERSEANITFALSCGNRSSPSVSKPLFDVRLAFGKKDSFGPYRA